MEKLNRKIKALITLIDDTDFGIGEIAVANLESIGTDALPELEKALDVCEPDTMQIKIKSVLNAIRFGAIKKSLIEWKKADNQDLLKGACLVAKFTDPYISEQSINKILDKLSGEVWLEISSHHTALEKIRIINHILYSHNGFGRNRDNLFSPENSCISTVLDSKKGNAVTLGIIYMLIAQKLDLPIYAINVPKLFILSYFDVKVSEVHENFNNNPLFFINPYTFGSILNRGEIEKYLNQQKLKDHTQSFQRATNQEIIKRLLISLNQSLEADSHSRKAKSIMDILEIFENE